jgi:hypothetical protein
MVQGLSRVPEREDDQITRRCCATNASASPPFFSSTCGSSGPDGFKYIFTVIDHSMRWLEAIPVKNLEATFNLLMNIHRSMFKKFEM